MKKVAFVCVHNSCRSQVAEALGRHLASEIFESYSAGTEPITAINSDAVRLMKDIYEIDMEVFQSPKLISDIPKMDIVITMGCNVNCPNIPCMYRDDWGLEDPSHKGDEAIIMVIKQIEYKVLELKMKLSKM